MHLIDSSPASNSSAFAAWQNVAAIAAVTMFAIGAVDVFAASSLSLSLFYVAVVLLSAWRGGVIAGITGALVGAAVWTAADFAFTFPAPAAGFFVWNACIRFGFLMVIAGGAYFTRKTLDERQAKAGAGEEIVVCACCKRIRMEDGAWLEADPAALGSEHRPSHNKVCPDCSKRIYIERVSPCGEVRAA